jgi:hypothetical protein
MSYAGLTRVSIKLENMMQRCTQERRWIAGSSPAMTLGLSAQFRGP